MFKIRKLSIRNFNQIQALEKSSYESYFIRSSREDIELASKHGVILGVFHNKKLIAYSSSFRLSKRINYKKWIKGIFEKKNIDIKINKMIMFCSTFVKKEFRGNGLQKDLRIATIKYYGESYSYISTIAIKNQISKKNLQSLGLKCIHRKIIRRDNVGFFYKQGITC